MVSIFDKVPKKLSVNDQKGTFKKWKSFRPRFWSRNFWEQFRSQKAYCRVYFKPNFRSLAPLVSILLAFEWRHAGFRSAFFGLLSKRRPFRPKFWKNYFWKHLWSRREYSRDYLKLNFRSKAPLVSILWAFEWRHAGFRSALFWPFVINGNHLDRNFGKILSGNIFDHKEDDLGVILSPISGL